MARQRATPARVVTFRTQQATYDVLEAAARASGVDTSDVINQALAEALPGLQQRVAAHRSQQRVAGEAVVRLLFLDTPFYALQVAGPEDRALYGRLLRLARQASPGDRRAAVRAALDETGPVFLPREILADLVLRRVQQDEDLDRLPEGPRPGGRKKAVGRPEEAGRQDEGGAPPSVR